MLKVVVYCLVTLILTQKRLLNSRAIFQKKTIKQALATSKKLKNNYEPKDKVGIYLAHKTS